MMKTASQPARKRAASRPAANAFRVVRSDDVTSVVEELREGLPYARFTEFMRRSGLPQEAVTRVMQTPKRTLARRKAQGRLRPDESERLLRLSIVFEQAVDLFDGNAEAARRWLSLPSRALGGVSPLRMAETEVGSREVENLIGRLKFGVVT
jgi:putative toxin-antitoxin system antitoxin component (TIGR02293 family)